MRHAALGLALVAACGPATDDATDATATGDVGPDVPVAPGCPQNFTREREEEPWLTLVHVVDGALVLEASADGVSVQTQLTAEDSGANVMRFEFSHLLLGAGGELRLTFQTQDGPEVTLTVTDQGALLSYPPVLGGLDYHLPFTAPPSRATIELHQTDEGLRTYANFFSAGDGQVLTGVLPRGEIHAHLAYVQLRLVGLLARAVMTRYVHYNELGELGYADTFDCDSLAPPNRLGWSTTAVVPLGTACASDAECGAADACVDGRCRRPCFTSRVCGGEVCLAFPDGAGYCRLPEEATCVGGACKDGLVCGVDGQCRRPCEGGRPAYGTDMATLAGTCGLNYVSCDFGDTCVETSTFRCVDGACADDDEAGAKQAGGWGCGYGSRRCGDDGQAIVQCNVSGPGFQAVEPCPGGQTASCAYVCPGEDDHEYACPTGATSETPRCTSCLRTCEGGEDVIDHCLDTTSQVAVDCETGFSWCSYGPGGDITRRKPGDLPYLQAECEAVLAPKAPPDHVAITPPGGSSVAPFHIDRTEITRAEYIGFLQSRPTPHDVPAACAANTTLLPGHGFDLGDWPWWERPDRPAMVDWCDAWAYCQWAGGHLCGELGGGAVSPDDVADPTHGAWAYVCTAGGTRPVPYGDARDDSACDPALFPYSDVGSHAGCTSEVDGFAGVTDQPGNAPEWLDACTSGGAADGSADTCVAMVGADCANHVASARTAAQAAIRCCYE